MHYNIFMETEIEEIGIMVEKNQISFDFLSDMPPKTLMQEENHKWVAEETLVILVKAKGEISPNFDICGKKMIDWVALATSGCKQKVIEEPNEENFLETIKNLAEDFQFVAVLFSDTPLLKKSTFLDIMDFFSKRRMNVLRLARGFVFRGEYLKNARMLLSSNVEEFDKEDFTLIDNSQKVSFAFKVLNGRILEYHKARGVIFFGEETIFVDADVEIESGAVIYPNNIIKGESYVGKNAILESGNYLLDTIVCDGAFVVQSYLEKSKVSEGKVVGPFARLINEEI